MIGTSRLGTTDTVPETLERSLDKTVMVPETLERSLGKTVMVPEKIKTFYGSVTCIFVIFHRKVR